jgi:putative flippase GtrA
MTRIHEFARFCVIGLVCFLVSTGVLTGLCELACLHYVASYLAAFLAANAVGYFLNGRYTFGADRPQHSSLRRYLLVNTLSVGINAVALYFLVDMLGMWYLAAAVLIAAVNMPVSFVVHRVFSYRLAPSQ